MSKHTQEPWSPSSANNAACVITGGPTRELHNGASAQGQIASACLHEWMITGERDANASRIVACVNACAGFTTEELLAYTGPRLLHTRLKNAFCRIDWLLSESNSTGLAIDAAIRDGVVPEQHPLRSRLEMLANHRQREQELLEAVELATHKVITCGVAARHPDANLSRRESDYGGKWNSPQAESVRKLRQERDELLAALENVVSDATSFGNRAYSMAKTAMEAISKAKGGAA